MALQLALVNRLFPPSVALARIYRGLRYPQNNVQHGAVFKSSTNFFVAAWSATAPLSSRHALHSISFMAFLHRINIFPVFASLALGFILSRSQPKPATGSRCPALLPAGWYHVPETSLALVFSVHSTRPLIAALANIIVYHKLMHHELK